MFWDETNWVHVDIVQVNVFTKTDIKLWGRAQYDNNECETLKSQQLNYLQSIMELPKGAPIAALYLELGILPIKYEIEMRQILCLKKVLGKKLDDPVLLAHKEMLRFDLEDNWANNLLGLRKL